MPLVWEDAFTLQKVELKQILCWDSSLIILNRKKWHPCLPCNFLSFVWKGHILYCSFVKARKELAMLKGTTFPHTNPPNVHKGGYCFVWHFWGRPDWQQWGAEPSLRWWCYSILPPVGWRTAPLPVGPTILVWGMTQAACCLRGRRAAMRQALFGPPTLPFPYMVLEWGRTWQRGHVSRQWRGGEPEEGVLNIDPALGQSVGWVHHCPLHVWVLAGAKDFISQYWFSQ